MKNGVYISSEACTPVFRKNGEYPMSDVYSERLFSRETRVSAWFSNSFAGAGVQFPASIVLWPAFVERAVLKPGEGFKHKNYTRFAIEMPLEGRIVCEARGKTYSAVPGEVALIHCGEDSAFQCAPDGNCRKISIGISGPLVHSLTTELHLVDPLTVKLVGSEAFLNLLLEIERKLGVREGVDYIGLSTLAFRLLSELAGMIERRYPPLLERALSIMKANISQRLTIAEIAEKLGNKTEEEVKDIINYLQSPVSLETPVGDDGENSLGDMVEDRSEPTPEEAMNILVRQEEVKELLEKLGDRERQVIRLRYGLEDGRTHTLEEIGDMLGVTRERVRQIEARAMEKLRKNAK